LKIEEYFCRPSRSRSVSSRRETPSVSQAEYR
jgi:hypothetical protein